MSIEGKTRLLLHLDSLIRRKTPGTSADMARKLGISKSTFFRLLDYAREELKVPIEYEENEGRYVYRVRGRMVFGFLPEEKS